MLTLNQGLYQYTLIDNLHTYIYAHTIYYSKQYTNQPVEHSDSYLSKIVAKFSHFSLTIRVSFRDGKLVKNLMALNIVTFAAVQKKIYWIEKAKDLVLTKLFTIIYWEINIQTFLVFFKYN